MMKGWKKMVTDEQKKAQTKLNVKIIQKHKDNRYS